MRFVNSGIRPPGGYYFIDKEFMRHEAEDVMRLVANLGDYRLRTGRELGNPGEEVVEQILTRNPELEVK